jgi:hypothetical protein
MNNDEFRYGILINDLQICVYICSCRPLSSGRQPQTYIKPEAAITVFELLMMSGVSFKTFRVINKHWNNKF